MVNEVIIGWVGETRGFWCASQVTGICPRTSPAGLWVVIIIWIYSNPSKNASKHIRSSHFLFNDVDYHSSRTVVPPEGGPTNGYISLSVLGVRGCAARQGILFEHMCTLRVYNLKVFIAFYVRSGRAQPCQSRYLVIPSPPPPPPPTHTPRV